MSNSIKAGSVAYLRTSDEPVYVMEIKEDAARVRRPINTTEGVKHIEDTFFLSELHTAKDRITEEAKLSAYNYEIRETEAARRQNKAHESTKPIMEFLPN